MSPPIKIELETWDGTLSKCERFNDPTSEMLHEALSRLDGNRVDCVWIEIDDVGALSIGGGPFQFLVASFPKDGSSSHVVNSHHNGGTTELQVGGQTGVYPSEMVMKASPAFAIAERFLEFRTYDPALNWVVDCPVPRSSYDNDAKPL